MSFDVIVAASQPENGIGVKGKLPWRLKGDMEFFKVLTSKVVTPLSEITDKQPINAVIMGRLTWESIPPSFRPLEGRVNVVITRNPIELQRKLPKSVFAFDSIDAALEFFGRNRTIEYQSTGNASQSRTIQTIFCIGGSQIYAQAFQSPKLRRIYLTTIKQSFSDCDSFLPAIPPGFHEIPAAKADEELAFALPRHRVENNVDMNAMYSTATTIDIESSQKVRGERQNSNYEVSADTPGSMPCLACGKSFPKSKIPAHQRSCIKNTFKRYSVSSNVPLITFDHHQTVIQEENEYSERTERVWQNIDHVAKGNAAKTKFDKKVISSEKEKVTPRVLTVVDERKPCQICSRRFNDDALERHIPACEKLNNRRTKVFDSAKARAHGTGLDLFTKLKKHEELEERNVSGISSRSRSLAYKSAHDEAVIPSRSAEGGDKSKAKWRVKHEQFIRSIRAARGDTGAFVPSEPDPDLVQCPVCERRFQKMSAERHIPFCKQSAGLQKFRKPSGAVSSQRSKANDALRRRTSFRPPLPATIKTTHK